MKAKRSPLFVCNAVLAWLAVAVAVVSFPAQAATITVNSVADDVYVNNAGATFSDIALTAPVTPTNCTLRMAIASANLDTPVGPCAPGNSNTAAGAAASGIPDTIIFSVGLAGTINVNVAAKMSEAPAVFMAGMGSVSPAPGTAVPNSTTALVVSRPLEIIGNVDAAGAPTIALDGGLLANPLVDGRLLIASDGVGSSDSPITITNLKFQNARIVGNTGGCMFSRESVRLTNVIFDNCVSEGSTSGTAYGGALGVFSSRSWTGALPAVGSIEPLVRPNVTLVNVIVRNSRALRGTSASLSAAGAMAFGSGSATSPAYVGNIYMSNVLVENCQAETFGGFVVRGSPNGPLLSSVEIIDSTIRNNSANGSYDGTASSTVNGGFVGGFQLRHVKHVEVSRTSVTGNLAGQGIGGMELRDNDAVTLTDVTASNNTVTPNNTARRAYAGGMSIDANRIVRAFRLTLEGNVLNTNSAAASSGFGGGAGIYNSTGSIEFHDAIVRNNTSNNGTSAGLYIGANAGVLLNRVKITGNTTTKTGTQFAGNAALEVVNNATFRLIASEVSGNTSAASGMVGISASFRDNTTGSSPWTPVAVLPPLTNTVLIEDSSIHGNTGADTNVTMGTPGIYTVRNSTIANNSSASFRAGLSLQGFNPNSGANSVQYFIQNSTIARNTVVVTCCSALHVGAWNGAADSTFSGTVSIESSIFAMGATAAPDSVIFANDPSKLTLTKTLIENGGGSVASLCGTNGNICNVDPLLAVLGNNGGPTKTLRLLPGSPAINAGSNPGGAPFDQRGATRVAGAAADMGAYETPAGSLTNCSLDMDGDSLVQANKEGLVLVRGMLGFTTANAVLGTGITQAQWSTVKANLNANCGTNFP